MRRRLTKLTIVLLLAIGAITGAQAQSIDEWLGRNCIECASLMSSQTGVYILEKGEEALIARAWLTQNATQSIDMQYFIWSTDNIGIAGRCRATAARGRTRRHRVRVLVDDLLIDAQEQNACCSWPRTPTCTFASTIRT